MFGIIEKLLGVVVTNKIRLLCGQTKRNPFSTIIIEFVIGYASIFKNGGSTMRFYLVIAPFFNLFILSGFFAFVFIMASNFYIFRTVFSK